jgi:hypothetical protein
VGWYGSGPLAEIRVGNIVVERDAIAECIAAAGQELSIKHVEHFGAQLELESFGEGDVLCNREVRVLISEAPMAGDASAPE